MSLLDRAVERRGRLVEDDESRVQDHRPRDRDALALAARELVREAVPPGGVEPHLLKGLRGAPVALRGARSPARARGGPRSRSRPPSCAATASRRGPGRRSGACAARGASRRGRGGEVAVLEAQNRSHCPAAGTSFRTARPSVDLPEPDSPTTPTVSPARTARSTPSTARIACRPRVKARRAARR